MKRIITLMVGGILVFTISAQTFSDNFDSYKAGDYVGVVGTDWTTWSGTVGGSEDAMVSDAQVSTTPNSIYFASTLEGGGPQDVVLNFGGEYNVGQFTFESSFFVETGSGAYFNFQSKEKIGMQWALDFHMVDDGKYYIICNEEIMLSGTYPVNTWFNLKIDIDLSMNKWNLYFDDAIEGSWVNTINQIASINIFPVNSASLGGNGTCSFYVDNVSYNITEYTFPILNGAIILVDYNAGMVGQERYVTTTLRNLGADSIISCDLTLEYNGIQFTEFLTDANIASNKTKEYTFSTPIVIVEGVKPCVVTISNINGTDVADAATSDDTKMVIIEPIIPALGKIVLSEEGTGTWCQWCPRGAVNMELMEEKFQGYWAGVAIHNNDPMEVDEYSLEFKDYVTGYPSALVNRGGVIDPSQMEMEFLSNIVIEPTGVITNGATYNNSTGELEIVAKIDWKTVLAGAWKMACVLTENGVSGSDSDYDQANAYSGGAYGVMGGYEMLDNPVPASEMVYNHVARRILPSFDGGLIEGVEGAGEGDTKVVSFLTSMDALWNLENMNIVVMLIKPDGTIDNVGYASWNDAHTNMDSAVRVSSEIDSSFIGGSLQMKADVFPINEKDFSVTWSVSSTSQASSTIDENGLLTIVEEGLVTVTATANYDSTISGTKDIKGYKIVEIESISITSVNDLDSVALGSQLVLSVAILPENVTDKSVSWSLVSSADSSYASINSSGVVTGLAEGRVTVMATANDGSGITGTFEIEVYLPVGIVTIPELNTLIYPNPTNRKFNIETGINNCNYTMYNLMGQPLIRGEFSASTSVDVTNLKLGVYVLEVSTKKESQIVKFIKK
jgi:uncharacterized protein YjdB